MAMKLWIEERIFSWENRFAVRDESGRDRYHVEGELLSWGKRLRIRDPSGREVANVEEQLFSFKPRYRISASGRIIGEVIQQFSFFLPRYTVEGADWHVEGDVAAHEYTVLRGETAIADIRRTRFSGYFIDIAETADEAEALALVLAFACAAEQPSN